MGYAMPVQGFGQTRGARDASAVLLAGSVPAGRLYHPHSPAPRPGDVVNGTNRVREVRPFMTFPAARFRIPAARFRRWDYDYSPNGGAPMELVPYYQARWEHAWRLRQEGLTLQGIGDRLGVTRERARQLVAQHDFSEAAREERIGFRSCQAHPNVGGLSEG